MKDTLTPRLLCPENLDDTVNLCAAGWTFFDDTTTNPKPEEWVTMGDNEDEKVKR